MPGPTRAAAEPGADSIEVLIQFGFDQDEIRGLVDSGAVIVAPPATRG